MKFMLMLKSTETTDSGRMPTEEELNEMGAFNEELIKAGVMLAGEGLHPTSTGVKIDYDGDERTITDGPFAETKELIAGFWILQTASKDEAVEWARRAPIREGSVEVRQVYEIEDFDPDNEFVKKEAQWREETGQSRTA